MKLTVSRVCSAAAFACFVGQVDNGVGHHISNPKLLENMGTVLHWSWFQALLTVIGISSVKVSIGLFLLRLVEGRLYTVDGHRIALLGLANCFFSAS